LSGYTVASAVLNQVAKYKQKPAEMDCQLKLKKGFAATITVIMGLLRF